MPKTTKAEPNTLPGYQAVTARFLGLAPGMVMDNGDRADPLDPIARVIDSLRKGTPVAKRTFTYHFNLAKAGYIGALWTNEPPVVVQNEDEDVTGVEGDSYLVLPGNALMSMMANALGRQRRGGSTDAKVALQFDEFYPLEVAGKMMSAREAFDQYAKLAKRIRVRNKSGQWVTVTRPLLAVWTATVRFEFQTRIFDKDKILKALDYAGAVVGIGSSRSRGYGRFDVELGGE